MVPSINLNASLAHANATPGKVAFLSQSDSLFATVLDWALDKGVGFSHLIALGSRIDVTFADILDYLGSDPLTRSIMLYVESIKDAREFMSAARAASRNKPVLVIRPGHALDSVLAGSRRRAAWGYSMDEVYDVAFRRAGMLRVEDIDGLFDAAQTLSAPRQVYDRKLAILTNGTSAGILAADRLMVGGGELAPLDEETIKSIDKVLGEENWSRANPVDIPFNADGKASWPCTCPGPPSPTWRWPRPSAMP
jgi:acetyltransferase